jgi:uncharacterized protein YchJ
MVKAIGANTRCPCGSGKKYKNCHGTEVASSAVARKVPMGYIAAGVIVLVIAAILFYKTQSKPSGQVWSQEHGHYHDAP